MLQNQKDLIVENSLDYRREYLPLNERVQMIEIIAEYIVIVLECGLV